MSIFKRMIEAWNEGRERQNLMDLYSVSYYDVINGSYYMCINYRNLQAGDTPDFYIEFENEQQAKQFMQDHYYTYYVSGVKQNGNKIDLIYSGDTYDSHIIKCENNEELAKNLVKLFRKQYEEYKINKRNQNIEANQKKEIEDLGIKF